MNDNNSQSIDAAQDLASALHKNRLHMQATNIFLALDPHTAQDDSTFHAWEQLARRALQFSQHGKIESAMALQINALQVAARLLVGPMLYAHPDRCMAAWVVSHHNVAQLLEQRQQLVLALDYLCDAHIGLRSIQSAPATAPEVQQAALRHMRETHAALLQWHSRYGSCTCIDAALRAPEHGQPDSACFAPSTPSIRFPSSHLH